MSGSSLASSRMAATYGGLWAGATSAYASIAASTAVIDALHAGDALAWTALKPMAASSDGSFRQCRFGSANCCRQSRTAAAWSRGLDGRFLALAADLDEATRLRRADALDAAAPARARPPCRTGGT